MAIAGAALAGAAAGYLTHEVQDYLTGDDFDEAAYEESTNDEKHAGVIESATEMTYYDDQVFTQISNLLENSKQVAYSDARYAAIEAMNLGDDEATVESKAEEAVDEFFVVQQENLLEHWTVQASKVERMLQTATHLDRAVDNSSGFYLTEEDPISGGDFGTQETTTRTYQLVDGTTFTIGGIPMTSSEDSESTDTPWEGGELPQAAEMRIEPVDTGSDQAVINFKAYRDHMADMETYHSDVISEIETFVSGVYPEYSEGDIDLSDVVRGSDLAALAHEDEDDPLAGADLAVMGLKANTESRMSVYLEDDGIAFDGSIYMKSDGTTTDLETGTTYSPGEFSGPVWLAYQDYVTDDGEEIDGLDETGVLEVDQDFTISEATDSEGSDLDTVTFEEETGQDTTTTDTEELTAELDRLSELQSELESQQEDLAAGDGSGGSGGFDIGADLGIGTLAVGAVVAFFLLGRN